MKASLQLHLVLLLILTLGTRAAAKCPTGTVTLRGDVINLPAGGPAAVLAVTLETPKGKLAKNAPISNGEFSIEISFSTLSSSFLGGDRCNNMPTLVEISVATAEKVYARKRIKFKKNFEMYNPNQYRLGHRLSIDVMKSDK